MGNRCLTDYLMACGMLKWYMHLLSRVICGMGVLFGLRIMRTGVSSHLCFGVDAEDKLPLHQFPHLKQREVC